MNTLYRTNPHSLSSDLHDLARSINTAVQNKKNNSISDSVITSCFNKAKVDLENILSTPYTLPGAFPLASIAHSLAKLKNKNGYLLDLIALSAIRQITAPTYYTETSNLNRKFNPQELAMLARSFSILETPNLLLFTQIANASILQIKDFTDQGLAMLSRAFANLQISHALLFDKIKEETILRRHNLNPENLAALTSSFAKLSLYDYDFFKALEGPIIENIMYFHKRGLFQLDQSFHSLNHPLITNAIRSEQNRRHDLSRLNGLHSPHQELQISPASTPSKSSSCSPIEIDLFQTDLEESLLNYFEQDTIIKDLHVPGELGSPDEYIDFLIPHLELIIQTDPPESKDSNTWPRIRALAEKNQYSTVFISYDEWSQLTSPKEKHEYLTQKIYQKTE